jgi:hypothetical protein
MCMCVCVCVSVCSLYLCLIGYIFTKLSQGQYQACLQKEKGWEWGSPPHPVKTL